MVAHPSRSFDVDVQYQVVYEANGLRGYPILNYEKWGFLELFNITDGVRVVRLATEEGQTRDVYRSQTDSSQ